MKILTLLITLIISLTLNAKVIHLECNGQYIDYDLVYKTELVIDTLKETLILPTDMLWSVYELDDDKYPPYGAPPATYKLTIWDDSYSGFRKVPNKNSTIKTQWFNIDRRDLTFSLLNEIKGRDKRNRIDGQCEIYIKRKNLI
jgi:hypothetical protein